MKRTHISILTLMLVFLLSSAWADDILTAELVDEYRKTLSELLLQPKDIAISKEIGKLYFHIGRETHDCKSIKMAVDIFETVLEKESNDAEIMVYLGSAYTLKARDFPLKWIANITPLGYLRIYYVKKGIDIMDDAVKIDGMHPVVRLIRGITRVNLPKVFLQFEKGIMDLKLVLLWIENPSLNKGYLGIITDKGFMAEAYYRIGEVYLEKGERKKASALFKKVVSLAVDTPIGMAAQRKLNE